MSSPAKGEKIGETGNKEMTELLTQLTNVVMVQQTQMAKQQESIDLMRQQLESLATSNRLNRSVDDSNSRTAELLATLSQRIKQKFDMDSDGSYAFSMWYGRYRELFNVDAACLDDKARVRLLLEQLSDSVHESFKRQLMPEDPYAKTFDETVKKLGELYDTDVSRFTQRYQCLKLDKCMDESLLDYTGRVNESCERAKVHEMTADDIKCLIWVFGLKDPADLELRQRLLLFLDRRRSASGSTASDGYVDRGSAVTLQELQKEALRYINIKKESDMIQNGDNAVVSAVHKVERKGSWQRNTEIGRTNEVVCYRCGENHLPHTCEFKEVQCMNCGKIGHSERCCWQGAKGVRKTSEPAVHDSEGGHQPKKKGRAFALKAFASGQDPRPTASITVEDVKVEMIVDTGSDYTLLNLEDYYRLEGLPLMESDLSLTNFAGSEIEVLGMTKCNFTIGKVKSEGTAYVTRGESVLGLDWLNRNESVRYHLKAMTGSHEDRGEQLKGGGTRSDRSSPLPCRRNRREGKPRGTCGEGKHDNRKMTLRGSPKNKPCTTTEGEECGTVKK
jgi:hypothetical protein